MHGQYDTRCTVTFPAAGHRCRVTDTKLYGLTTEAPVCEQLAEGRYLAAERPGVKPATSEMQAKTLTNMPHVPHFSHELTYMTQSTTSYWSHSAVVHCYAADCFSVCD